MSRGAREAKRESESKREWKLIEVPASLLMSVKDPRGPADIIIYLLFCIGFRDLQFDI